MTGSAGSDDAGADGIRIGTAIVSYIEPHAGVAREFNRWYERDHFPAAVMAGPGAFSGARFVATRACRVARADARLWGDPSLGSYLSVAWLLPDAQAAWDAWIPGQMQQLVAEDRMFAGRDHLHTAVYEFQWDARAETAPPASLVLDTAPAGVIAVAIIDGDEPADLRAWAGKLLESELPVIVGLRRERLLVSTLDSPAPHQLLLAFVRGDVIDVWARVVATAVAQRADIGFAGPFFTTVAGTDTYVDDL